jgi:pSer/pThr/pTyr-binding forkhead associated (FHA) protein
MDRDIYDPTIKTSTDELGGPVENPGSLVEATPNGEVTFVLDLSVVIIGCDDAADIKFEGRSIAPYHAEIVYDDGEYSIRHVDGSALVLINGQALDESTLADGDAIAIGERAFTFRKTSYENSSE